MSYEASTSPQAAGARRPRAAARTLRPILWIALLPLAALAEEHSRSGAASFFSGVEMDNQDSRRLDLGMSLRSARGTRADLAGSRTETDSGSLSVTSTSGMARLEHDFGRMGLAAGIRRTRDQDLSRSTDWIGEAFANLGEARLAALVEHRSTDFDEILVDGAELALEEGEVGGTAQCSVKALGYGLRASVYRAKWSFYGSAKAFDYSSYECSAAIASAESAGGAPPPAGGPASSFVPVTISRPEAVAALNSTITSRLSGYSATLLPREMALLESSLMAGAAYALGAANMVGMEIYRDSEQFASARTTTLLGYFSFRLSRLISAELTLGTTRADLLDDSLFAGVRFSATVGN